MKRTVPQNSPPKGLHRTAAARMRLANLVRRATADQRGATAVEYALIAAGIGAVVAATVYTIGRNTASLAPSMSNLF